MVYIHPSLNEIKKNWKDKRFIPIYTKLRLRNDITPVSVYECFRNNKESIILESVKNGRFSYVCFNPILKFVSKNGVIHLYECGKIRKIRGDPFEELRKLLKKYSFPRYESLPLFFGGFVGYLAYDLVHYIEDIPSHKKDDLNLPDSYLICPQLIFVFDYDKNIVTVIILTTNGLKSYGLSCRALNEVCEILHSLKADDKEGMFSHELIKGRRKINITGLKSTFAKEDYKKAIIKAKDYIFSGDSFQIKLSQRFEFEINSDPLNIYNILRKINPSPYSAYLDFKKVKLVSCSPEHLLKVENGVVTTRPIGGTYPRGRTEKEDNMLASTFFNDEKELAEHTMLIDLERNDIGKVCSYGSVKVDELMTLEKYSHLMHIVTNITGRLWKDKDCIDAVKAVFPGGTVTGCPKVRTMEIISELEPTARGPYTGSIGFINFNNELDLSIIIRTLIVKNNKGYVQVGGGIVADSDPEKEYNETITKAMALIESINLIEMSETALCTLRASARSKQAVSEHAQKHAPCS